MRMWDFRFNHIDSPPQVFQFQSQSVHAYEFVSRSFLPGWQFDVVYPIFVLGLSEGKTVHIDEYIGTAKEFGSQLLHVRCGCEALSPTAFHVEKQAVGTIEAARLQGDVHGGEGLLTYEKVQNHSRRRVMTLVENFFFFGKPIEIIESFDQMGQSIGIQGSYRFGQIAVYFRIVQI